jgi:hypothetical protein
MMHNPRVNDEDIVQRGGYIPEVVREFFQKNGN